MFDKELLLKRDRDKMMITQVHIKQVSVLFYDWMKRSLPTLPEVKRQVCDTSPLEVLKC